MTTDLVLRDDDLSNEEIQLIKDNIAKEATDAELALFVRQCNRTRLDPFARQIHLVPRWDAKLGRDVRTAQVSIDGMRLVAERSNRYAGQTEALYCGKDGLWTDVWLDDEPPWAAKIGVYKDGFVEALWATATWKQFAVYNRRKIPNTSNPVRYEFILGPMWAKMPAHMLAKCAEALALRKAFPHELSGLYIAEELADEDRPRKKPSRTVKKATKQTEPDGTETRTAPVVIEGEPPTDEQRAAFKEAFTALDEEDKVKLNDPWAEAGLPSIPNLNREQMDVATALVMEILNYVEPDEPQADEDGVEIENTDSRFDGAEDFDITPRQITLINIKCEELGITTRPKVHACVSEIVGTKVTSLKQLKMNQASKVIDELIARVDALG